MIGESATDTSPSEGPLEPAEDERFTLQSYYTPRAPGRLRWLPRLMRTALGLVWRAAPRELLLCAFFQLVIGVSLAVQLLVLRNLLSDLLVAGGPTFSSTLPELVTLAVIGGISSGANVALDVYQRILGQLVALHATDQVIRTATSVELIAYESPLFHDRLQRAQVSAASRPAQLVTGLLGILGALFAIVGTAGALLIVEPILCALVVVAFVPAMLATQRASRLVYRYTVEQTERERRRLYLFGLLTSKREAQEVRAFDLGGFLGGRHRELYRRLIDDLRVVMRKRLRIALTGQLATSALTAGALATLIWFVTSGRTSLAQAGSAAAAMILLSGRLRGLTGSAGGLYEGSLYLEDYAAFAAAAPGIEAARPTTPAPKEPHTIVADGVTFTYPSRTEPSLVDASLELRRGEVVALVGENGSGKTTFAKLLAGLYHPEHGAITWDGVDAATYDPVTVRERVAVIFQDFVRYELSAHDNIALGNRSRYEDEEAVRRAARAAGIDEMLGTMRQGYDTLLGPEFYGGSDLSGGQWQRVGLARAFFRDAPLVILDEPTASLDPRAEAALYDSMRDLFAGRGVLLISHRFGSVRTADRIYVLRDGRITESGTHADLMKAGGYYAELFRLQASWYVD